MPRIRIAIDDADALDALARFPDRFVAQLAAELARRGPDIERELRRRVPRLTGELGDSATVRRIDKGIKLGYKAHFAPYVYYRRKRFGARTVRQTLAKYRRTQHFRRLVRESATVAGKRALGRAT